MQKTRYHNKGMSFLAKLMEPVNAVAAGTVLTPNIVFHGIVAAATFLILVAWVIPWMANTASTAPKPPIGWSSRDYDAAKGQRKSLADYLATIKDGDTIPITRFNIATANYGGIFTENYNVVWNPWAGTVSPDAARLQVEGGARAIVFDIWPNPGDFSKPIVAAMIDTDDSSSWPMLSLWKNRLGLSKGVGRYSNWQRLTRNVGSASDAITAAIRAAFQSEPSAQNEDPFFLILNLHGAMKESYLNYLGTQIREAIGGHALAAEWSRANNQQKFCSTPMSSFLSKVVVIVNPDIQTGYNSLPGINTRDQFNEKFLQTTLGEVTNVLTTTERQTVLEPGAIATISAANQPNCAAGNITKQSLAQTGLVVIQPSIGGSSTDNKSKFRDAYSLQNCMQSGAQFVAVNMFSRDSSDPVLESWFDPSMFGTYSFRVRG